MDDESVSTFDKVLGSLDCDQTIDSNSKRTKSIIIDLEKNEYKRMFKPSLAIPDYENDHFGLESQGLKIVIPSNRIDIYT